MPTVLTNTAPTLFIYILFFLFVSETFLGFFIGLQAVLFLDCLMENQNENINFSISGGLSETTCK